MKLTTLKNYALPVLFIFLIIVYFFIGEGYTPSSDQASGIIIGNDIANGNIFLNGWSLSTVTFYFTDLIWYALLSLAGVSNHTQAILVPAILLSALTCLSVYLVMLNKRVPWALFFSFGIIGAYSSGIFNLAVSHIGAYVYTSIVYILLSQDRKNTNNNNKIWITLLSTVIFFSDDISKYTLLIPIIMSLVIDFAKNKKTTTLSHIFIIIFSYILSKVLLHSIIFLGGFQLPGVGVPKFVTISAFIDNIRYFLVGSLNIFQANIFGMDIGALSASTGIRFLFMIFFYGYITWALRKLLSYSFLDSSLLISSIIMPIAFIFSNIPSSVDSIRYIAPSIIFGSIFISRNVSAGIKSSYFLLITALASGGVIYFHSISLNKKNIEIEKISNFIENNNLKRGFASFWYASSISLNSKSIISPVVFNEHEGSVKPFLWLSKYQNYENNNTFIIADNESDRNSSVSAYGAPDNEYMIESKIIMIWKDGISIPFDGFKIITNDKYFGSIGISDNNKVCPNSDSLFMVTGPYKPLKAGKYKVNISTKGEGGVSGDVVAIGGNVVFSKFNDVKEFIINVDKAYSDVEVRIYNRTGNACIKSLSVSPI
ncbi:hypothetical protein KKJ13_03450 [Xenorhabdus bovienii]|uniref:hypothetical protein n=1 Tax=Xenorhabdus bovienii TaxID=40576 RepID=UPI0023B225FE|nr:hypothetical protein [Xenorhabdus bovienii]MDE9440704.1 hypothetical protein [Xenorhabdus bovienii]